MIWTQKSNLVYIKVKLSIKSTKKLFLFYLVYFVWIKTFLSLILNLLEKPEYIVTLATYSPCPLKTNTYDCAIFTVISLLHIEYGTKVDKNMFSPPQVSNLELDFTKYWSIIRWFQILKIICKFLILFCFLIQVRAITLIMISKS
jgi:hypothetical protein